MKRSFILIGIILLATVLVACGGPEEKKEKFFKKGRILYEKGDYVKARLEFKNAIQVDPKLVEAALYKTIKETFDILLIG